MFVSEVFEREAVEVVLVGGVAERTVIGVVGGFDANEATWFYEAVELLHRTDHVCQMLDDVDRPQLVERAVRQGVREPVQIANNVGCARRINVDADGAWILANSAADVENFQLTSLTREPLAYARGSVRRHRAQSSY